MDAIAVMLTLLLLAAVIAVVSSPLRSSPASEDPNSSERGELFAAREAKYREIRDAELDYQTGKLSPQDFKAVDSTLRAEAVEILDRIEALGIEALEEPTKRPTRASSKE
jgi:hypothetical protein